MIILENNSPLFNKRFTKDEEIIICNKAINSYGNASQKIKAIEEMGELIQAISKSLLDNENNVEEEIADVEIMLTQLKIMYNLSDVENWRNYKLNRLKDRVWQYERLFK